MKVALCAFVLVLLFAASWENPVKRKYKMINKGLFEGDMKIPERSKDRNAVPDDSQRWPGGRIYYDFDENDLSSEIKEYLEDVVVYLEDGTCLTFERRTTQRDYVHIYSGDGCWSYWGRLGGKQNMSLQNDGCNNFGIVMHEMLHAVGFEHEHSRHDRDDYLEIHWDNIEKDFWDQFEKRKEWEERRFTPFDFDSIMLYGPSAFAKEPNLRAVSAKNKTIKIEEVPDKLFPSDSDLYRVNTLYECPVKE